MDNSNVEGYDVLKGRVKMRPGVSHTQALRFVGDIKRFLGVDLPTAIYLGAHGMEQVDTENKSIKIKVAVVKENLLTDVDFDCVLGREVFQKVSWEGFLAELDAHRKMIAGVKMSLVQMEPKEVHSVALGDSVD
jgi:hypothetical protein